MRPLILASIVVAAFAVACQPASQDEAASSAVSPPARTADDNQESTAGDSSVAASGPPRAEAMFSNGSFWTGVPGMPRATTLAIAAGRVLYVGDASGARRYAGPETEHIDLGGRFAVPGFIDNHTHFLYGGIGLASVNLRDAATPEEFTRRIGAFSASLASGKWVVNGDWDHESWGGELPRADWIDAVTPATPVFVMRLDGHMGLANTKAMSLAGVTAETPDPAGGMIVRGTGGAPSGVFKDTAMNLIMAVMPPPGADDMDAAFTAAQAHALARGITQIHDMDSEEMPRFTSLETFRRAQSRGNLNMRVYSFFPLRDWPQMQRYVELHGRGDAWLRWGAVKGFVDGSLGSTTAWFHAPYDDAPASSGFPVSDLEALAEWIVGADAAGLHVAVHAIGDRANDWLLDQYGRIGGDNIAKRRFRVEHAQHLTRAAISRFGDLGVIASTQPYHAIDDGRWAEKRIGPGRIRTTYAFADLLAAGAQLTFGSDWSVAPLDPLSGIYAAVTRRTLDGAHPEGWVAEQKIPVEQALRAYTAGNAYAGFQERELGTLEAGKLADFVVLSEDLFAIAAERIGEVHVLRTVVGGASVYLR